MITPAIALTLSCFDLWADSLWSVLRCHLFQAPLLQSDPWYLSVQWHVSTLWFLPTYLQSSFLQIHPEYGWWFWSVSHWMQTGWWSPRILYLQEWRKDVLLPCQLRMRDILEYIRQNLWCHLCLSCNFLVMASLVLWHSEAGSEFLHVPVDIRPVSSQMYIPFAIWEVYDEIRMLFKSNID